MKTTLILSAIYLTSVLITWNYMKIAHGKNGRWSNLDTGTPELLLTLTPILNSFFIFIWLIIPPFRESKNNFNNFFKVKK